ncbi:24 kDa secreted protein [Aphelenchoides besseyi]|nr:24 kDa secreted protein [Aphelenchoides besseyi]
MRSTVLILLAFSLFVGADVVDKVATQAEDALNKATAGGTVRQCTCDEQHECITELEGHGLQCVDSCWSKFNKMKQPHARKKRATSKFLKSTLRSCWELLHKKLLNAEKNVSSLLSGDVKEVLDTLTEFGTCVKGCLEEKNSGGFCFDKKACQPLLDSKEEAKKAAKKCARQVNFKQHAGEVCECAKKAGVANLDKLCPLIKAGSEAAQDAVKGSN